MALGGMAGQHAARRRDVHDAAAPAAHAGLGELGVVVRHDEVDDDDALQALRWLLDDVRGIMNASRVGISAPRFFSAQA